MPAILKKVRLFSPVLFLVPTLAFLIVFAYIPFFRVFKDSFFWFDGASPPRWLGLTNYIRVLTTDTYFWPSMWIAIKFALAGVLKIVIFPLIAAEMIHLLRGKVHAYWYRVLLILPTVVPSLITIFIWKIFYHPNAQVGVFNAILVGLFGPQTIVNWLTDQGVAFWSLVLVGFPWAGGFAMLIYLAGLQTIPTELYDAAAMDGATSWRTFWYVELPLIRGQLKLFVVMAIISSLQSFTLSYVMTGGGPNFSTMVPGLLLYRRAFGDNQFGYASAMAVIVFLFTLVASYLNIKFISAKSENY